MLWSHATKHYGSGEQLKKLLRVRVGQHFTFLSFDALAVSFASG